MRKKRAKLQKQKELRNKPVQIPKDPVEFFEKILRLKPFPYQAKFLRDLSPLKVFRWCRRAGKTTIMSGDDICFAANNPRSTILVIMPKFQQIKEIYFQGEGGLHEHLARMDRDVFEYLIKEQLQTIIRFRNGSRILAEVPEPFTIRGHGPRIVKGSGLLDPKFAAKLEVAWERGQVRIIKRGKRMRLRISMELTEK